MNINKLLENLTNHGFKAMVFQDEKQMIQELVKHIDKTCQIGFGGSMTLKEIGVEEYLITNGYNVMTAAATDFDRLTIMANNRLADVYLTSANGVSEEGVLVNIDGIGNRLGATCFGAKKLFYIIGTNKIEETVEKAIWRAKNVASPKNSARLNRKTPCAVTGKCEDCNSPERICRGTLITERAMFLKETFVYIINKELGF